MSGVKLQTEIWSTWRYEIILLAKKFQICNRSLPLNAFFSSTWLEGWETKPKHIAERHYFTKKAHSHPPLSNYEMETINGIAVIIHLVLYVIDSWKGNKVTLDKDELETHRNEDECHLSCLTICSFCYSTKIMMLMMMSKLNNWIFNKKQFWI